MSIENMEVHYQPNFERRIDVLEYRLNKGELGYSLEELGQWFRLSLLRANRTFDYKKKIALLHEARVVFDIIEGILSEKEDFLYAQDPTKVYSEAEEEEILNTGEYLWEEEILNTGEYLWEDDFGI